MNGFLRKSLVGLAVICGATLLEAALVSSPSDHVFGATAEARIGRPLTPMSYAGVARRTTYRVVRRSTIYVAVLPTTCVKQTYDGALVYRCGSTYYQPYGTQYVVVYID